MSEAGRTSGDTLGEPDESTRLLPATGCGGATTLSRAGDPTPLPMAQLIALVAMHAVDPIAYTQIFPYINQLLADLRIAAPEKVGYYSGFIESVYSVAETLAVYQWGRLSDIVGRRPVVLFGLVGVTVSTIAFGFSTSLVTMLASRFLGGLVAGNTAVFHSILVEITDDTNKNIAALIYSLSWPMGAALGPLIGGTFANAATRYPRYFSWPVFVNNPSLLPCIMSAACTLLVTGLVYFLTKETLPSKRSRVSNDVPCGTLYSMSDGDPCSTGTGPPSAQALLRIPALRAMTLSGFALSFLSFAFDAVFTLLCYTPVDAGGLGLRPSTIGNFLAFAGTLSLLFQLVAMPYILRRFDYATTYNACMYLWPVTFALLPLFNALALSRSSMNSGLSVWRGSGTGLGKATTVEIDIWIGLVLVLTLSRFAHIPYSITMFLVKRHVPAFHRTGPVAMTATGSGSALGRCNGLIQSAIGLGRAVGPVVVSALFTTLNGSTWARRWGIGWTWSAVMVCFAVVGARITKGLR